MVLFVKVGGYLAFIGLFCLEAGLALSTGQDIQGFSTWGLLLNTRCCYYPATYTKHSRRTQWCNIVHPAILVILPSNYLHREE